MTTQQDVFTSLISEADEFTSYFFPNNSEPSRFGRAYNWLTSDTKIRNGLQDLSKLKNDASQHLRTIIAAKGKIDENELQKAKDNFLDLTSEQQNEFIKTKGEEATKALNELRKNNDKIAELERQLEEEKAKAKNAEGKSSISETINIDKTSEQILPVPGSGNDVVATMTIKEPSNTPVKTA